MTRERRLKCSGFQEAAARRQIQLGKVHPPLSCQQTNKFPRAQPNFNFQPWSTTTPHLQRDASHLMSSTPQERPASTQSTERHLHTPISIRTTSVRRRREQCWQHTRIRRTWPSATRPVPRPSSSSRTKAFELYSRRHLEPVIRKRLSRFRSTMRTRCMVLGARACSGPRAITRT